MIQWYIATEYGVVSSDNTTRPTFTNNVKACKLFRTEMQARQFVKQHRSISKPRCVPTSTNRLLTVIKKIDRETGHVELVEVDKNIAIKNNDSGNHVCPGCNMPLVEYGHNSKVFSNLADIPLQVCKECFHAETHKRQKVAI